jgi:rubrerythrin
MGVFGLRSTSQNLQGGIDGETYEIDEMYPTYLETAKFQVKKEHNLASTMLSPQRRHMPPYSVKPSKPLIQVKEM